MTCPEDKTHHIAMTLSKLLTVAVAAAILGNAVTFAFLYALWRIRKNGNDWVAIGLALFCCVAVALTGYLIRYQS